MFIFRKCFRWKQLRSCMLQPCRLLCWNRHAIIRLSFPFGGNNNKGQSTHLPFYMIEHRRFCDKRIYLNINRYGVGVAIVVGVSPPVKANIATLWARMVVTLLLHWPCAVTRTLLPTARVAKDDDVRFPYLLYVV